MPEFVGLAGQPITSIEMQPGENMQELSHLLGAAAKLLGSAVASVEVENLGERPDLAVSIMNGLVTSYETSCRVDEFVKYMGDWMKSEPLKARCDWLLGIAHVPNDEREVLAAQYKAIADKLGEGESVNLTDDPVWLCRGIVLGAAVLGDELSMYQVYLKNKNGKGSVRALLASRLIKFSPDDLRATRLLRFFADLHTLGIASDS